LYLVNGEGELSGAIDAEGSDFKQHEPTQSIEGELDGGMTGAWLKYAG
jgi:hypothetical protein